MRTASVTEAHEAVRGGDVLIDVRTHPEWTAGHVPGARFMPMVSVPMRLSELDARRPVYVICDSGARSFQVCQFLEGRGFDPVNVLGGMAQWRAMTMEMETGE
jgi:rhodanese-related sulfurtransferase